MYQTKDKFELSVDEKKFNYLATSLRMIPIPFT